ncbi:MAG: LptA/OstA family protein [Candidatus Edwardsbacteria bacterium]
MLLIFLALNGWATEDTEPYFLAAERVEVKTTETGRVSYLQGGVGIFHRGIVLTGNKGIVWEKEGKAAILGAVKIVDEKRTITADEGYYYRNQHLAILKGKVKTQTESQTLSADSVVYYRDQEKTEGYGHLVIVENQRQMRLFGEEGFYSDKAEYGVITGKPRLVLHGDNPESTITITSQKMELYRQSEIALATKEVVITKKKMTAYCDKATFFNKEERAVLEGNPSAEEEKRRVEGDTIELFFKANILKEIKIKGKAKSREIGNNDRENLLFANTLVLKLEGEKPKILEATGQAQSIYFPEKEKGKNFVWSEQLNFSLNEGELTSVIATGKPKGIYIMTK